MIRNRRLEAWFFVFAYAGFIFYLSSQSAPLAPLARFEFFRSLEKYPIDKLFHIVEYTVLGVLLIRAAVLESGTAGTLSMGGIAAVWIAGVLYGYSDEWHQRFVPGRQYDMTDWVADMIGISIGIYSWLTRYKKGNKVYA